MLFWTTENYYIGYIVVIRMNRQESPGLYNNQNRAELKKKALIATGVATAVTAALGTGIYMYRKSKKAKALKKDQEYLASLTPLQRKKELEWRRLRERLAKAKHTRKQNLRAFDVYATKRNYKTVSSKK